MNFKLGIVSLMSVGVLFGCVSEDVKDKDIDKEKVEVTDTEKGKNTGDSVKEKDTEKVENYVSKEKIDSIKIGDNFEAVIKNIDIKNSETYIHSFEDDKNNKSLNLVSKFGDDEVLVNIGFDKEKVKYKVENVSTTDDKKAIKIFNDLKESNDKTYGEYSLYMKSKEPVDAKKYSETYEWNSKDNRINLRMQYTPDGLILVGHYTFENLPSTPVGEVKEEVKKEDSTDKKDESTDKKEENK